MIGSLAISLVASSVAALVSCFSLKRACSALIWHSSSHSFIVDHSSMVIFGNSSVRMALILVDTLLSAGVVTVEKSRVPLPSLLMILSMVALHDALESKKRLCALGHLHFQCIAGQF